jgi:acetylornithine/succinyldiaminopimelate/putrescine aminotransferase
VRLAPPIAIEAEDLGWMVDQFAAVLAEASRTVKPA